MIISIRGADGIIKASCEQGGDVRLVYAAEYAQGDVICLQSDSPRFVVAQLEDSLAPVYGYLNGEFNLAVPFGEKAVCYSPKCFGGGLHVLWAREANDFEIAAYRNLAFNPLDSHDNCALFPHAFANVETRGESVFAARNVINGNITSHNHGTWPFESWGINRRDDAEITIDFGRAVRLDALVLTLRADFPHDNWWHHVTAVMSDGHEMVLEPCKTGAPQRFELAAHETSSVTLKDLKKDEDDPSPFPALVQLECWGYEGSV